MKTILHMRANPQIQRLFPVWDDNDPVEAGGEAWVCGVLHTIVDRVLSRRMKNAMARLRAGGVANPSRMALHQLLESQAAEISEELVKRAATAQGHQRADNLFAARRKRERSTLKFS